MDKHKGSNDDEEEDEDEKNVNGRSRPTELTQASPAREIPGNESQDLPLFAPSAVADFLFSGVPASPPQYVSFEQIMEAASGVSNMVLAHEIALDDSFQVKKVEPPPDSLHGRVKTIMHDIFWTTLEEELNEDPPIYTQALKLLDEVKENMLSLLLPHNVQLRNQIMEVFDVDLIRQQAERGVLDFTYYSRYILSVMSRMCAPVRDEEISSLTEVTSVVPLFRGILTVLDLMKLDMVNFTIQQIRPHILQHSVEYERMKFKEFLKKQGEMFNIDGLEFTTQWLRRSYSKVLEEELVRSTTAHDTAAASVQESTIPEVPAKRVLMQAFLELLEWDQSRVFPETLLLDQGRFLLLQSQITLATIVASVLLVTYSTVGTAIQGISDFKTTLKNHVMLLLEGPAESSDSNLQGQLESVAVQVISEVQDCLKQHGYPAIDQSKETVLKGQIQDIASPDHGVRKLIRQRIFDFIEKVCASSMSPLQVPPGLSTLQTELSQVAGQFLRLVTHNQAVFGDYYMDIIRSLQQAEMEKREPRKAHANE